MGNKAAVAAPNDDARARDDGAPGPAHDAGDARCRLEPQGAAVDRHRFVEHPLHSAEPERAADHGAHLLRPGDAAHGEAAIEVGAAAAGAPP